MTIALDLEPGTLFLTLEDALADFRPPAENLDRIHEILGDVAHDRLTIPQSRAFIAVERAGLESPVAFVTQGYVALVTDGDALEWIELPAHQASAEGFAAVAHAVEAAARRVYL